MFIFPFQSTDGILHHSKRCSYGELRESVSEHDVLSDLGGVNNEDEDDDNLETNTAVSTVVGTAVSQVQLSINY